MSGIGAVFIANNHPLTIVVSYSDPAVGRPGDDTYVPRVDHQVTIAPGSNASIRSCTFLVTRLGG